jgi:RHS repeat-associated protein
MLKNKIINVNKCAPPNNKTEKTHSVSVYDYDALGRRTLTQNVTGQTLRTVYDGRGFEVIREGETFRDGSLTTSYSSSAQTRGQNNTLRSNEPTGERYRWISEGGTAAGEGYAIQGSRYGGRGVTLYGNGEAVAVSYGSSAGGKSVYLGKDLLGSVRSATADGGNLEDRYEYDAFGQPYAGDLEGMMNLGYTGKPYDAATGLYNYGYRDYRPQAARFTTLDPIRDGSNWFAYVNNDPVNWIDPWGLEPGEIFTTVSHAAYDFARLYNNDSIINNREYGASVYKKGHGYTYTVPNRGSNDKVIPSLPLLKLPVAILHTHAAYDKDYGNGNNSFSKDDIFGAKLFNIPSFLATPNGSLLVYFPSTDSVITLISNIPSDENDPTYKNDLHPSPDTHIDNPINNNIFNFFLVLRKDSYEYNKGK